jgi:hypothetical protein
MNKKDNKKKNKKRNKKENINNEPFNDPLNEPLNDPLNEQFNDPLNDQNEDNVRKPDISYKENLIGDDNILNNLDDELSIAIKASRDEYYNDYDEELRLALEVSKEEHFNIIEENIKKESILEEELILKKIESNNRRNSLSNFCKKIQGLSYTEEDIKIKKYIEKILDDYFELNIDNIIVDKDIYISLYKIIDSYYFIPISKNKKKTAISKEEDTIIRNIFLA